MSDDLAWEADHHEWDTDHLAEAKLHLQLADEQMQKIVAPALDTRLILAAVHALTAIAEALESASFTDLPVFPVEHK
jgi:hypothetical protein